MACFLVPMAQAIATTIYRKHNSSSIYSPEAAILKHEIPALEKMLWGGTVMLIVDHIINGEIMFRFPFFTAFTQAGGTEIFLKELLTVGLPMSIVLTAAWALWALVSSRNAEY